MYWGLRIFQQAGQRQCRPCQWLHIVSSHDWALRTYHHVPVTDSGGGELSLRSRSSHHKQRLTFLAPARSQLTPALAQIPRRIKLLSFNNILSSAWCLARNRLLRIPSKMTQKGLKVVTREQAGRGNWKGNFYSSPTVGYHQPSPLGQICPCRPVSRKEFWAEQQWGCCGWRPYFVGGSHARQGQHSCKSWYFSLLKTTCPVVRPPRGLEKLNGFDAIICGEESGMWSCHHSSLSALSALMKAGNNLTAQARGGDWGLWSGAKWGRNEGQWKYLLFFSRLQSPPVTPSQSWD